VPAVVALLTLELFVSHAHSLKEKRMVLRRVKDRLAAMNLSVAETAHQDLWQRATLSVVAVRDGEQATEAALQQVIDHVDAIEPGLVARSDIEFLT
jgi:uncharacterized protein